MQNLKKRKSTKYIAIGVVAILCIAIALISGLQSYNAADIPVVSTANENSNYAVFENGSTYVYTDLSKVETAHANSSASDTSTIVVDREQNHGTLQNPYVINDVTQWNYFAEHTGSSDVDKVFVLGKDITFTSSNFVPVPYFYGKFYGGGHTFKNVNYNFGSNNDCGVFRVLHANGIIADLNLDNVTISSTGGRVGALVGTTNGGDILNCHVKGSVSGTSSYAGTGNQTESTFHSVGGLVGRTNGNGIKVYIYRCSVNVKMTVLAAKKGASAGGILGGFTATDNTTASCIYDCLAITNLAVNGSASNMDVWFGGITNYTAFIGEQAIENCVAYTNITNNATNRKSFGSLFDGWANGITKLTIKNVFSDAIFKQGANATIYSIPGATWYSGFALPNATNVTLSTSNINWYASNTLAYGSEVTDFYTHRSVANTKYTGAEDFTQKDMYDKAQSDLPSNIWMQSDNITPAFMSNTDITSTAGYTVEKAPNRNTNIKSSNFTIKFVNLENNNEVSFDNDMTYNYNDTTQLYTPTPKDSNHVFVGWTLDKNGEGTVYHNIPAALYGDVTMYAIWDAPQASVTKENIISTETGGVFTKEYSAGSTLTMQGDIAITGMTGTIEYKWYKNGETTTLGTASTYAISTVAETGDYVLDYVFTDSNEPLWRHSGSTSPQRAEITPGQLYVKDGTFVIADSTVPYMGKRLRDINFTVTMIDTLGRTVAGTPSWKTGVNQVQSGINNEKITFAPTDTNYVSNGEYTVTFDAQYLTLTFKMDDVSDTIVTNMTYNQTYTTNNIIQAFYTEFVNRLANDPNYAPLNNMTPMLDGVKITEYSGQFINVTELKTINVTFVDATYTVTFDPDNGDSTFTNTETIYYNNRVTKPSSDPVNGDKVFLGWYLDDNTAWDFDNNFVTSDIRLTAKYLDAVLDLVRIEVELLKDSYTATEQIKEGDLKVTAYYAGDIAGYGHVEQDAVLSFSQYTVDYENTSDNCLHVGQGNITVKYTYKGHQEVDTANLPVVAKKVDTSGLRFTDKTATHTGNAIAIDRIRGILPDEIVAVNYVYTKNGVEIAEADVKDIGTYIVQAMFVMDSIDFEADPLRATLKIVRAGEVLTAVWDNTSFAYNGLEQHPTAKLFDGDGLEIADMQFHYEGDDQVKNVGSGYTIKVVLDESGYQLDPSSATCNFAITKAILNAPTVKADSPIVYDGNAKSVSDYLDGFDPNLMNIASGGSGTNADSYTAIIELPDTQNCEWSGVSGNTVTVEWEISKAHLTAVWSAYKHVADGTEFQPKVTSFVGIASIDANAVNYDTDVIYSGDTGKSAVGAYSITAVLNSTALWTGNYILDGNTQRPYVIIPQEGVQVITIVWGETELAFNGKVQMPSYTVYDENDNDITDQVKSILKFGGDYDKSKWADDYTLTVSQPDSGYYIMGGLVCDYTITLDANGNGYNPNGDEEEGKNGGLSFDNVGDMLKQWWQVIASVASIILIIVFMSKGIGYANKKKEADEDKKKYASYYAAGATGLFGLAMTSWTVIACILMGLAVISFVFMILMKKGYKKAQKQLDDTKEEYGRNRADQEARQRDENMRMMLMGMMGGQGGNMGQGMPQGGFAYAQPGIGAEDIRGIISETVTALLPGVQQALPQQASNNDEVIKQIMKTQEDLAHNQELLMKKMTEQPAERIVEREVASTTANDETIKRVLDNQDKLMQKILELTLNQNTQPQVQVIEKEVPIEKIVEKVVEVPVEVEKIVEKEVPVEVEKIVEKEVVKEVKVEVPVEVEKIVEKEVIKEVKVAAPEKPKKEIAPRLTLDEAYASLSKQQQKYFDGLKQYALSKPGAKEKKSTYAITIGQSTVNPLLKLTIKKDMTVALFKMEDEYLKDIKRDATSDGTKVKVKETEVEIADAQACKVAKNMIDLREDQIERYNDLLKEQRAMNRKK